MQSIQLGSACLCMCLLLACGGRTDDSSSDAAPSESGADVAPVDSASEAAADAGLCFGATVPSVPYKVCNNDSDCMSASHQTDCCGNSLLVGIAKSQAAAFGACEAAWDKTFPGCGCPSGPPQTEDGKTLDFGVTPIVRCVDRTASSGICKTFAP